MATESRKNKDRRINAGTAAMRKGSECRNDPYASLNDTVANALHAAVSLGIAPEEALRAVADGIANFQLEHKCNHTE
jgi:hypothetical protein